MRWLLGARPLAEESHKVGLRGGRFVDGFLGEQFALPEAVESLRAMRNLPASGEIVTISAGDPLNLVRFIVPGDRVPAISGKYVSFQDGVALGTDEHIPSQVRPAWMEETGSGPASEATAH